jgi:hypothetical protein
MEVECSSEATSSFYEGIWYHPEDGDMFLRDVNIHLQNYTVSQSRGPQSEQSLWCKPQNLQIDYL